MNLSVGQQLKAARLSRDLSLQDVAHETRIPVARLQHLEEDNLAAFGAITYARSFLLEYGRFLNVDVSSISESLPPPVLGGSADYRYLTDSLGPWVGAGRQKAAPTARLPRSAKSRKMSPKSTILTLSALFIIMVTVWGLWVEKLSAKNPVTNATPTAPESKESATSGKGDDFSAFRPVQTLAPDTTVAASSPPPSRTVVPSELAAPKPEIIKDDDATAGGNTPVTPQQEIILKPATVVVKKPQIVE